MDRMGEGGLTRKWQEKGRNPSRHPLTPTSASFWLDCAYCRSTTHGELVHHGGPFAGRYTHYASTRAGSASIFNPPPPPFALSRVSRATSPMTVAFTMSWSQKVLATWRQNFEAHGPGSSVNLQRTRGRPRTQGTNCWAPSMPPRRMRGDQPLVEGSRRPFHGYQRRLAGSGGL